ncbi:MAG: hypothetical protein M5R38_00645 [Candidatus Methylomirabilis sp.]|nr:hypothetical protein [Candidatus Methylomirabilis sp.]
MWKDPIVEEVRKIRQRHAAKFNYDLDAICRDLQEQEQKVVVRSCLYQRKNPLVAPRPAD